MTVDGPYRGSAAAPCVRCGDALPVAGPAEPQACHRGCGTWYAAAALEEHLSPELLERAPGGAWWKQTGPALPCPSCGAAMQSITLHTTAYQRCAAHGAWLGPGVVDALGQELAAELARARQARDLARALRDGTDAERHAFARRYLAIQAELAARR